MMRDSLKIFQSQKGQTLIEAVVAMAIALVLISSVLTLVNRSNARATNARQATQASKLAQEGMEIVRNIRDVNEDGAVRVGRPGCINPPFCSWSDLYTDNQVDPTSACLSFDAVASQWRLLPTGNVNCEPILLSIFTREVLFADDVAIDTDDNGTADAICANTNFDESDTKRITVTVTWQSPVGSQERNVISCLTSWQNR